MSNQGWCPYSIGDYVVYMPSKRGVNMDVMTSFSESLIPGKVYRVAKIQDGLYVTVEDYSHPGGGLYWSEFEVVRKS